MNELHAFPQLASRLFNRFARGFHAGDVGKAFTKPPGEVAFEASDIGEELLKNEIIKRIDTHPNKQEFSQLIESSLEDEGRINEVASRVEKLTNERFEQHMEDTRLERLRKVVRGIPPATLASVAQSLISIVPLRQALSGELGTVGGPIDVATITRADGFKWVQHKSIGL
jgi:hypothetical protein